MQRRSRWLTVGGLAVAMLVGIWLVRSRARVETQPLRAGALRGANVLLVTIDTLRADHVGAYSRSGDLTPTLDEFAHTGLRFERVYAHVPLTLPSHATLMTARYPTRNGVRDNGTFHLGDESPTLAATLKAAGYRTGAFVGAFVLDARFGLNRGFDLYDDRMSGSSRELDLVQRTADQVLAPAYEWIVTGDYRVPGSNSRSSSSQPATAGPWFAWIHLYDPHEPYAAPEPFRSRYNSAPYDGEIAYADAAFGHFVTRLRSAGALADTVVVVASDHGESLGEHGERTHGLFAYDSTLHVPLVMWAAGKIRPGVFAETMRLVDVAPTLLDLLGAASLTQADGRSVRPFLAGEQPFDEVGSYFEALNANLTRNWAPLTGILRGRAKLIDLPVPELYDLASDPAERHNIYASQRDRARDLERRLDAVTRSVAPSSPVVLDGDVEARLRSLGYVVGSTVKPARRYSPADDPKQLVHLNQALDDAATRWSRGDAGGAIEELRAIIAERPDLTVAYDRLAVMLHARGRVAEAVAILERAAHTGNADRPLLRSLGSMLREAGEMRRSAAVLEELVRAEASDLQSADALAQTYTHMGRRAEAEALFKRVLSASPNDAAAWNNLGALYLTANRLDAARAALARAIEIDPSLAGAHNGLGVVYARSGDLARAVSEWRTALDLQPNFADARANLDRLRQ